MTWRRNICSLIQMESWLKNKSLFSCFINHRRLQHFLQSLFYSSRYIIFFEQRMIDLEYVKAQLLASVFLLLL